MTGRALIAWNLRRLRTERGLSQGLLAEASGVNRGHLRELERETVSIRVDLLDLIAGALGVRVGAFFTKCHRELGGRSHCRVDDRAAGEPQWAKTPIPFFCVATEAARARCLSSGISWYRHRPGVPEIKGVSAALGGDVVGRGQTVRPHPLPTAT
jgi:transcriptional regulator with XRE-family HTH domain